MFARFRRPLLVAAFALLSSAPAGATEWIHCGDATDSVSFAILVGHLPFLAVNRAYFTVGEDSWSTSPSIEPGEQVELGQAFGDDRQILVDLTDANSERIVAELRVFVASEGDDDAKGGTLRVPGRGVWVVVCSGP